jgi:hypothetical protein
VDEVHRHVPLLYHQQLILRIVLDAKAQNLSA